MTELEQSPSASATLIIITGMSGAGKTIAVQSLEDLGFFCVDNLPPVLIPKFAELIEQSKGKIAKVALVIDLRGGSFYGFVRVAGLHQKRVNHRLRDSVSRCNGFCACPALQGEPAASSAGSQRDAA